MHSIMQVINHNIILSTGLKLHIRRADGTDAEATVNYLNKIGGESDFLSFGLNEFPLSVEEESKIIAECLNLNKQLILVGIIDNAIVSHLFLQRSNKKRFTHIGEITISVSKAYWGCSIALHMIDTAIKWSASNEITKLQLYVRTDNMRAVQLYKRLGFLMEGTITRSMRVSQIYYNVYIMGLEI